MILLLILVLTAVASAQFSFPPHKEANPEIQTRLKTENGEQLWQGDMLLTQEQVDALIKPPNARKAKADPTYRWPNGVIPFSISASSQADRQAILNGIKHWTDNSCLKFTEVREDLAQPHVIFRKLNGCYSYLGRVAWMSNGQTISIGEGCEQVGIIAHEIGHAIGFYHEQSRPERDQYVKVLSENIINGYQSQFIKWNDINNYDVPYDLGSLMHYGLDSFTKNGKNTMVPIDVMKSFKIGQRNRLSFYDLKLANIMYKCDAKCTTKPSCRNGGFVDHNCRCRCPDEYQGNMCEKYVGVKPPAVKCGGTITSPTTITSPNFPNNYPKGAGCIWIIKAPSGKKVSATFDTFKLMPYYYYNWCPWDFLEIRDSGYDGNKYCAQDLLNKKVTTSGNQMILLFKSEYDWYTGFRAQITFT